MSEELTTIDVQRSLPKSVQSGIPRLGAPKIGWRKILIGDLLFEVNRPIKLEDSTSYELVTVKRSRGGVVSRGRLTGKAIVVKSQFIVKTGDFLISKRQIVHGACGIVPPELDGAVVSNEYSVLHARPELDLAYLAQLTHSVYLQQTFFHSSIGVHVEKMIFKLDRWFKWEINLPEVAEQIKIATFLGAVDHKTSKLKRKKALLCDYKLGVMQQIFSQNLRFNCDDNLPFQDWVKINLADIATFYRGAGLSKSSLEPNGEFPCVLYGELFTVYGPIIRKVTSRTNSLAGTMCKYGDILMPSSDVTPDGLGRASALLTEATFVGGDINIIRPNEGFSSAFLSQLFNFEKNKFIQLVTGTTVKHVYISNLKKLNFLVPQSIKEQEKIASCLSAIDAKIDALSEQIEKVEAYKKGLLQQLFA